MSSEQDYMTRLLQLAQHAKQLQQRVEQLEQQMQELKEQVQNPILTKQSNAPTDMTYYLGVIENEKVRKITMPSDLCIALVRLMDLGVTQKALMDSGIVTQSKVRGLSAWTTQYTRAFAEVNGLMEVYRNPLSDDMRAKYPLLDQFYGTNY